MADVTDRDIHDAEGCAVACLCRRCARGEPVSLKARGYLHFDNETRRWVSCGIVRHRRLALRGIIASSIAQARAEGYAAGRASVVAAVCQTCGGRGI